MDNFEICQRYRQARNKSKMIKILADMSLKSEREIIDILIKAGEIKGVETQNKPSGLKAKSYKWSQSDIDYMFEAKAEGKTNLEIAEHLGLTVSAVSNKWYKMNSGNNKTKQEQLGSVGIETNGKKIPVNQPEQNISVFQPAENAVNLTANTNEVLARYVSLLEAVESVGGSLIGQLSLVLGGHTYIVSFERMD